MSQWRKIYTLGEEWDSWICQTDNFDAYHLSFYIQSLSLSEKSNPLLLVMENEDGLVVHPLLLRPLKKLNPQFDSYYDAASGYGYGGIAWKCHHSGRTLALLKNYWEEEREILSEMKVVSEFIRVQPLQGYPFDDENNPENVLKWKTIAVDLSLSDELLWNRLSDNHKRNIKKAVKNGLTCSFLSEIDESLLDQFVNMYYATMIRLKAKSDYFFSSKSLSYLFSSTKFKTFLAAAWKEEKMTAAFILLSGPQYMHYHLGASTEEGRQSGSSYFLMYNAILKGKKEKLSFFHLGGDLGTGNSGLFRFKKEFGGDIKFFYTRHRIILDREYQELCHYSGINPEATTFFPAYRDPTFLQERKEMDKKTIVTNDANGYPIQTEKIKVIILGGGGHSQVIVDICNLMKLSGMDIDLVGILDDNPDLQGEQYLGIPIFASINFHEYLKAMSVIGGIGDNRTRKNECMKFSNAGCRFFSAIHPKTVIAKDVTLGKGIAVAAGVVVNTGSRIGDHVILNTSCSIDHHNSVGDFAHIAPGVHLGGNVSVGEGALIGIGAAVLPGVHIGAWAVVGAGSVVTRDVPDNVVVYGNPARIKRQNPSNTQ